MTIPIATYPSIIVNNLKHSKEFFSKPQLEHFAQYLTGLIVSYNRTVQGINDNFVFYKDQSNLNRFLTEAEAFNFFYEDSKQNLGLEDYEMRKLRGITRHWYLVFLAYTLLQLGAFDRTLRRWLKANVDTIGEKCRFTATEIVKAFILFVLRMNELKYDVEEIMTLLYLPRAKLKIVPVL